MITTQTIHTLYCDTPGCNTKSAGERPPAELWELAQRWAWQKVDGKHLCPICLAKATKLASLSVEKGGAA